MFCLFLNTIHQTVTQTQVLANTFIIILYRFLYRTHPPSKNENPTYINNTIAPAITINIFFFIIV